jgi:BirA family transcriptional regulator, biotin operon repressor / biotin---[acetyl-CoA-carboxylase] ligase
VTDSSAIAAAAPPLPPGWRLELHESLSSTSDHLVQRAHAGEPAGLAVLARRQTAGRGREGRGWQSPAGNLFLSVLLRPPGSLRQAPAWSLLAAVALAEALAVRLPDPEALSLKWPNDLLLGGAKLAGVLVEVAASPEGDSLDWLVIGTGVNLAVAPPLPDRATASLLGAGAAPVAPEVFAGAYLATLNHWERLWRREGFRRLRAAWLARGPAEGSELRVRQGEGFLTGRFAGLAEDGCLLLDVDGRRRAIAAGEVAPG